MKKLDFVDFDYRRVGAYLVPMIPCPETSHKFPSQTQPDLAYDVDELIERHRAGILTDLDVMKNPRYAEEPDFDSPDMEKVGNADIAERHEFIQEGKRAKAHIRKKEIEESDAKRKGAEEARIASEVEKRLKAASIAPPPTEGVGG